MEATIDTLNIVVNADIKKALADLKTLNTQLAKLGGSSTKGSTSSIDATTKSINAATKSAKSGTKSMISGFSKLAVVVRSLQQVFKYLGKSIEESMDYSETVNLFQTSMRALGKKAGNEFAFLDKAEGFNSSLSEKLSLDPDTLMNYQAIFAQMSSSMGVAESAAYDLSESFTMLGADIASLFNIDVESAYQKLQSALSGQARSMREFGVDISVATMQEKALELGINKKVAAMTQAEKVQLRYIMIMEGLTVAQGDMARTLESPANQLRILSAQFVQLTRAIGNVFMPVVTAVMPYINAVVLGVKKLVTALAQLVGYKMPDFKETPVEIFSSDDMSGDVDDVTKSVKALKRATLGIDELNVLNDNSSASAEGGNMSSVDLSSQIAEMNAEYKALVDGITAEVGSKADDILNNWIAAFAWVNEIDFSPLLNSIKGLISAFQPLIYLIGNTLAWCVNTVLAPLAKWGIEEFAPASINAVTAALEALQAFLQPFIAGVMQLWDSLQPIIEWAESVVIVVIDGVRNMWEKLADVFTKKGTKIQEIISGIGEIISAVWVVIEPVFNLLRDVVEDVFSFVGDIIATVVSSVIDILHGLIEFIVGVFTGDWNRSWEGIKEIFAGVWELIKCIAVGIGNFLKDLWNTIKENTEAVWNGIKSFIANIWETIKGLASSIWDGIKSIILTIAEGIKNGIIAAFNTVKTFISDCFNTIKTIAINVWNGIWGAIKGVINSILGGIEGMVNGVIKGLNLMVKALNKLKFDVPDWVPGLGGKKFGFNIKTLSEVQIPKLAEGGLVNTGQMFIAREAGPELVGTIGKQNAVMNNNQIVESVSRGVSDANSEQNAILRELVYIGKQLLNKESVVNAIIGTNDVISSLERANRRSGKTLVPVGL